MIDLRSDTVTRPSAAMMEAMISAQTGDDVYGEDPTVNKLETLAAELTAKEAGLFVSSGTQGNLLALLSHCERGDEYIAGQDAHTYQFEGGGGAVLGGIQPQPLAFNDRGELDLNEIATAIKPNDYHFARTRLVCLENTQSGKVLSLDYIQRFSAFVAERGLRTHLDGARVFNASVRLEVPVDEITRHFDTVSICLSKGLAAPVGSLLVGDKKTIDRARRWRKILGGGMRQAGILAAAGIYALTHHIERLAEDHDHADELATALKRLDSLGVIDDPDTNMVMLDLKTTDFSNLNTFMAAHGITLSSPRLVLHRDISHDDVQTVIDTFRAFDQGRDS
ncbi:MAG: low-specificity L-threonine aldolase [Gammaproteobacteria bacterium]|nr:low-specificity L-threonine aldolase [Gammaproteobacteria bacterium]